eukprot:10920.XXX_207231_207347_1 [CDS] Oithona nana genome sequencing.
MCAQNLLPKILMEMMTVKLNCGRMEFNQMVDFSHWHVN